MSNPPSDTAAADYARAQRKWFIIGLIVRGVLIAALVLTSRYFLPVRQTSGISHGAPVVLLKALIIWIAWAGADITAALLIRLRVGHMLTATWTNTCLEITAVAAIVILKIKAGPYWIALWALLSAAWILVNRLLTANPPKILDLAVEGPITGPRAEALLQFINANERCSIGLKLLVSGDRGDRMRAAYGSWRGTHTIYLTGNMLELMDDRELRAVVAHELGHHRLRHRAYRGILAVALPVAAVFLVGELAFPGQFGGIRVAEGIRGAPMVQMYAWLLGMMMMPLTLALSRREELSANAMAIEMTDDPDAFISAMEKLARHNRISGEPDIIDKLLFQTHPSLGRTVDQARQYAAANGIDLDEHEGGNARDNRVC